MAQSRRSSALDHRDVARDHGVHGRHAEHDRWPQRVGTPFRSVRLQRVPEPSVPELPVQQPGDSVAGGH